MAVSVICALFPILFENANAQVVDLTNAGVILTTKMPVVSRYADVLVNEVQRRTGLKWPIMFGVGNTWNGSTVTLAVKNEVEVAYHSAHSEGYTLTSDPSSAVHVEGTDARGLLFGIGKMLRVMHLNLTQNYYTPRTASATIASGLRISSSPDRPMRGVQIGYRPKTNSYDGLTVPLFRQLVIDLALFGLNQVELIPHAFDDAPFSPHYALAHPDMNVQMAAIADELGLNVSLWYPACNPYAPHSPKGCVQGDYRDPKVMAAAKADWQRIFSSLSRVDTLFINAGDPGGHSPDDLVLIAMAALDVLKRWHPQAQLWICPQDWSVTDYNRWRTLASAPNATRWLSGVIYGPGMSVGLEGFAQAYAPNHFPVRLYPDITHSLSDQLPVPNWDPAFAWTEGRETVNPRPITHTLIAASQKPFASAGIGTYNEGAHDDVNKHVWLAQFWGADDNTSAISAISPHDITRSALAEYSNLHFGASLGPKVLRGIYGLERDWVGRLTDNMDINATHDIFVQVQATMAVRRRWNWRLQQLMYRANYDKLLQVRATIELAGEAAALSLLSSVTDPDQAMNEAERVLNATAARSANEGRELHVQLRLWAEALFQSIHQQFSVPLYGGEYTRRGNNLDTALLPLSDAPFLLRQFRLIRQGKQVDKKAALLALAHRKFAGPGGYYDDLGAPGLQPHYVHDAVDQTGDQALQPSPKAECTAPSNQYYQLPPAHQDAYQQSRFGLSKKTLSPPSLPDDQSRAALTFVTGSAGGGGSWMPVPVVMRYLDLPANTAYTVAVTGLDISSNCSFTANGNVVQNCSGHNTTLWPMPTHSHTQWVCDIPVLTTKAGGALTLAWTPVSNVATKVRLAEVWLRVRT